jgi:hypothetical protein
LADNDVDEAFEWLVLIIGIVCGIMNQFPDLFWLVYTSSAPSSLQAAKTVVIPILLTLMIWLIGKFTSRQYQPVAKVIAWLYVSELLFSYCLMYFWGIEWIPRNNTIVGLGMVILNIIGPVVIFKIIVPRYREIYSDSIFLKSKIRLLLLTS